MLSFILFAIFNAAFVSAVKIDVDMLDKQSFEVGVDVLKPVEKAQNEFRANLNRFQNLNNVTGDLTDVADLLLVYGKVFAKLTTSYDQLSRNLHNVKTKGKNDIDISKSQYISLLDTFQNLALANSKLTESLDDIAAIMQFMVENFYKIKIYNGQIYLPKKFFIYFNNALLTSAGDFHGVGSDYKNLRKIVLQIASGNVPASAANVLKQMGKRYETVVGWFKRFSTLFYQLEASAVTYTGNLNLATGGRCTSENLEDLLTKINYVAANLLPVFSSVVTTYTNKANLY